jgi:hypothetical protein
MQLDDFGSEPHPRSDFLNIIIADNWRCDGEIRLRIALLRIANNLNATEKFIHDRDDFFSLYLTPKECVDAEHKDALHTHALDAHDVDLAAAPIVSEHRTQSPLFSPVRWPFLDHKSFSFISAAIIRCRNDCLFAHVSLFSSVSVLDSRDQKIYCRLMRHLEEARNPLASKIQPE